jgi:hypothetical protein
MSLLAPGVVLICGHSFELGGSYRPGRRPDGAPRRLIAHDPRFPWPGRAWVAWTAAAPTAPCTPSHFVPGEHGGRRFGTVAEAARSAGVARQSMWKRLRDPLSGWRRLRP